MVFLGNAIGGGPTDAEGTSVIRISAKVDYAVQALVELARSDGRPVKVTTLAASEGIPRRFLAVTLGELRRSGIVESRRGSQGGFWLARPADTITVTQVFEAIDGEVVELRDVDPGTSSSSGWLWALTARRLHELFGGVTIADIVRYAGTDDHTYLDQAHDEVAPSSAPASPARPSPAPLAPPPARPAHSMS